MDIQALKSVSLSVRSLSMDAIEKANAGHPGLPLGCAELGALLYGELLSHNPAKPDWLNRDRFVLSAGHGSMFLYSMLHLAGYGITLDNIKSFRQVGSPCAGHPEYGYAAGIEMTTGPLGQGLATAVGMAIAEKMLAARFNTEAAKIIDHYTYVLAGDGCLQEGVSSEASSLAGHLGLGKLILFYDSNGITIDGKTDLSFTEDVSKRYEAYGWQVLSGDMYDFEGVAALVAKAKADSSRPSIIVLKSVIGKGAPTKQGTADSHGAPLGPEEVAAAKKNLGIPEGGFWVDPAAIAYFKAKKPTFESAYAAWDKVYQSWRGANAAKATELDGFLSGKIPAELKLPSFAEGEKLATRQASGKIIAALATSMTNLVGGSADLMGPNNTKMPNVFTKANPAGQYIHFGIREFGMAAICNGLALHGGLRPFCATFMVFTDYLRPALRLASIMKQPVIYVMTHDSIFLGEDGPTHQPIEHIASLRAIPGVQVLRPADCQETVVAWKLALEKKDGPTVLCLSRQSITNFPKADPDWENTMKIGAYIAKKAEGGQPDVVIAASGSEVGMALAAAALVPEKRISVVSVPNIEAFLKQDKKLRETIIPHCARVVTIEAGVGLGWERIASGPEDVMSIERFGESGPGPKVAEHLGFTVAKLVEIIKA